MNGKMCVILCLKGAVNIIQGERANKVRKAQELTLE